MRRLWSVIGLAVAWGMLAGMQTAAGEADFVVLRKDDLTWRSIDEFPGIDFALIEGSPSDEGIYVMRARFIPGAWSQPHFHSSDRLVTVISGVWYAGTDASFDKDKTTALYPGDFMKHPAGGIHYDGAKDGEVIVEISGMGPVTTTGVPIYSQN